MAKILQVIWEDTHTCPCCGESHAVQECVVERRIAGPGFAAQVPGRYFYCANADEFFEDGELQAWNEAQAGMAGANVQFSFGGMPPFAAEAMQKNAAEVPREDEGK